MTLLLHNNNPINSHMVHAPLRIMPILLLLFHLLMTPCETLLERHGLASCPVSYHLHLSILFLLFNAVIQQTAATKFWDLFTLRTASFIFTTSLSESSTTFFITLITMNPSHSYLITDNTPFSNICDSSTFHCAFNSTDFFLKVFTLHLRIFILAELPAV